MAEHTLGDTVQFPAPVSGHGWPAPRAEWYPMKPSDVLQDDGQLFSRALDRTKHNQHNRRYVIEWQNEKWTVVRLPLGAG